MNMKKKIVLWGNDEKDNKILIALELKPKENQVYIYSFGEDIVSENFYNQMMDDWRTGKTLDFPEGYQTIIRELSVTEDILPETIKVQRADLINRAKAEWHFVVLSTKLYDLYNTELEDLKDRIDKLVDFDSGVWEEIKGFWSKVVEQSQERNLFREHAEKLKAETNNLFTKMKEFKTKANEQLSKFSKEHVAQFTARLDEVKEKVAGGKSLNPLFEELKKIQREFNGTEFTRNDRSKVWKRIDEAFKIVKEKKYGKPQEGSQGPVSRVERRYQGLKSAIGKMQASISRDKRDIEFQNKRVNDTNGQLEMQIRQAKVKMIEERINSKQEKLDEMLTTQVDLEKKIEKEKEKAEQRAVKKEVEKKKAEVKEKIKAEMKDSQPDISEEKAEKLKAAAVDINAPKGKKKKTKAESSTEKETESTSESGTEETESLLGAAAVVLGDAVENMVDSVKAVGSVISDKAGDKVHDLTEKAVHMKEEVSDKLEDLSEKVGLDKTIEKAKDKLADAKEAIQEKVEDIKEDFAEKKAKVDEKVEEVKEDIVEKKTEGDEEADGKAEESIKKAGLLATAVAAGSKLVKEASEKIEDLSEKAGLDETIAKAKDKLAETKEAIEEKVEDIKEDLSEKKDKVADKVEEEKEEIKKKGGLLATAVAAGSKLVKEASEKMDDLSEKVGLDETIEKAKEKLVETKEAIEEKVEDIKEDLAEKKAKSTEKDAEGALKKGGLLATAVAAGSKLVKEAAEKMEDLAEKTGLDETIEKAKETLEETKEAISDTIDEAKKAMSESEETVDEVAERVRKSSAVSESKSEEEE